MTSIRQKLWLGFGGLLLIMVIVSVMTLVVLTRYSHALEQLFHDNYNSVLFCDAMKASLDQLSQRAQRIIWQVPAAPGVDVDAQEKKFSTNLVSELGNCTLPGEKEKTLAVISLWHEYEEAYLKFDNASAPNQTDLYRNILIDRQQKMEQLTQQISDMNMANMMSLDGQVKKTIISTRDTLLVLVLAGTMLAALVVWAAGAAMLRPLQGLMRSAREIEAGNLDMRVPVRSLDEIGQLAEAFNSMAGKLREFRQIDHDRLIRTQQTTQLAIDSLPDAVFVISPAGIIEISNVSARTYFGIEPGLSIAQLRPKWLTPLFEEVCKSGKPVEPAGYQSAIQLFEGTSERFLLPRAEPMIRQGDTIIGVTVILVDVTGLHSADEAKSSLVSTVSHELRTPLTSIRMALNLLTQEKFGVLDAKQTRLLKVAREDTDRLYRIVENLLSMSRMESGRAQFQLRPMLPREIVTAAVESLRGPFSEKGIRLTVNSPENLPQVLADPGAVGSALTNLLSNALKFTPTGGDVSVACAEEGDFVAFTVRDTGPGIPEKYAERIFDKFFRVPTTEGPTGAGLGLAIAKEVILAHGGHLELCHPPGPGSTFKFTLRRA
jgi:signal transduction histidine kinase